MELDPHPRHFFLQARFSTHMRIGIPELESMAHVVEIPANDPRWYDAETGGAELLGTKGAGHHLLSSRSAKTASSTATHSATQIISQTERNVEKVQMKIAELKKIVAFGCHEWIHSLSTDSSLLELWSRATPILLLEKGILCLRGLLTRGILSTVEDDFALSCLCFAVTYILHHEDLVNGTFSTRTRVIGSKHWKTKFALGFLGLYGSVECSPILAVNIVFKS